MRWLTFGLFAGLLACEGETTVRSTPVALTIRTCLGDAEGVRFDPHGVALEGGTTCRQTVRELSPSGVENACLVVHERESQRTTRLRLTLDDNGLRGPTTLAVRPGVVADVALFFGAADWQASACDGLGFDDACGADCALKLFETAITLNATTTIDWLDVTGRCQLEPGPGLPGERCDGQDNDCDGAVDEAFSNLGMACEAGLGACRSEGVLACGDGDVVCDAQPGAVASEACDGVDNDCDGATDEGLPECCVPGRVRACGEDVGACTVGMQTCENRAWGACDGQGPVDEHCDTVDNDCDGLVDEDFAALGEACTAGVGACARAGMVACVDNAETCDAAPAEPQVEVCNGVDDDCDGTLDEVPGVGGDCVVGVGECARAGLTRCEPGLGDVVCDAAPGEALPEVVDELDNDCDGTIDEAPGCTVGVGACERPGRIGDDGCEGEPGAPTPESCDGLDNDCDGAVDEAGCGPFVRNQCRVWLAWDADRPPQVPQQTWGDCPADERDSSGQARCVSTQGDGTFHSILPPRNLDGGEALGVAFTCNPDAAGGWIQRNCGVVLGVVTQGQIEAFTPDECPAAFPADRPSAVRCAHTGGDGLFHPINFNPDAHQVTFMGIAFGCESEEDPARARAVQSSVQVWLASMSDGEESPIREGAASWGGCPEDEDDAEGAERCVAAPEDGNWGIMPLARPLDRATQMGIALTRRAGAF